jgi:hypothetical protein
VGYVPLTALSGGTSPSAPLAGAFTPDDKLFFVSTAGDNSIHSISVPLVANADRYDADQPQPAGLLAHYGFRLHFLRQRHNRSGHGHCHG